ncbi:MAG: hypothetical protein ACXAC7_15910 [Candidatus Hodarchaeales archaeon]|jgi:hypothetical protein
MTENESNNVQFCQANDCPSPKVPHGENDVIELDNKIICLFCFSRKIARPGLGVWKPKPIKKVERVEIQRIPPKRSIKTIFSNFNSTERIPPAESLDNSQLKEELEIWTTILSILETNMQVNTRSIESIINLYHKNNPRIIKTDNTRFLVQIKRKNIENDTTFNLIIEEFMGQKLAQIYHLSIDVLPVRVQKWIQNTWIGSEGEIGESELVFTEPFGVYVPLEDLNNGSKTIPFLETVSYEFGRWIYLGWLLGNLNTLDVVVFNQSSEDEVFILPLQSIITNNPLDSELIKSITRRLPITMPFLLDIECIKAFKEGATLGKIKLQELFENNKFQELVSKIVTDIEQLKDPSNWPDLII